MIHNNLVYIKISENLVITLKNLNGVPSLLLLGHIVNGGFLDMSDGMLDTA